MLTCAARLLDVRKLCQHFILTHHRLTSSSLGQRAVVASRLELRGSGGVGTKLPCFGVHVALSCTFCHFTEVDWHQSYQEICECEVTQNCMSKILKIKISNSIPDKRKSPLKDKGIFHHHVSTVAKNMDLFRVLWFFP